MAYFEIDDEDEPGFFGLLNDIWGEADARRQQFIDENGEDLGHWLANIRQYGAAWWGDVWQEEARRVESHPAFSQIGDSALWDHKPWGTAILSIHIHLVNGEDRSSSTSRGAEYSIAGGKIIG